MTGDEFILIANKEVKGNEKAEYSIQLLNLEDYSKYTLIRFGNNVDMNAFLGLEDIFAIRNISHSGSAIDNMGLNETVSIEDGCMYHCYDDVVVEADFRKQEFNIIYQASCMINTIIEDGNIMYINGLTELISYNIKEKQERSNSFKRWMCILLVI